MKPEELRPGNYYLYKGSEIKFDISDFKEIDYGLLDLLKPIPLTEDKLIELGLEKYHHKDAYILNIKKEEDYKIEISINIFSGSLEKDPSWFITICNYHNRITIVKQYVHQLQNIYYDLTGKELSNKL